MSRIINKNVSEDDLYRTIQYALEMGWRRIKLYFMIGLPYETWNDIEGIINMIRKVEVIGKKKVGKKFSLNVSINTLVPKPHTPFQWVAQEKEEELKEKYYYIAKMVKSRHISYNFPNTQLSLLEAIFARGDRRLGKVLEEAYKRGCKFDSWRENFNFAYWEESFRKCNLDMSFYAHRIREKEELFPWDIIDCGVKRQYLWTEWEKARQEISTEDCRWSYCHSCGLEDTCSEVVKNYGD
jgi:radical SAM superfamily enzyme YgiQ (UPF0313 family)